jgi:hypothetical protein
MSEHNYFFKALLLKYPNFQFIFDLSTPIYLQLNFYALTYVCTVIYQLIRGVWFLWGPRITCMAILQANFLKARKSQIQQFLGLFHYRKFANFLGMRVSKSVNLL